MARVHKLNGDLEASEVEKKKERKKKDRSLHV